MSVWDDAPAALYMSDFDFAEEFGRQRTPEEQEAHERFSASAEIEEAAVLLARPDSELIWHKDEEG